MAMLAKSVGAKMLRKISCNEWMGYIMADKDVK